MSHVDSLVLIALTASFNKFWEGLNPYDIVTQVSRAAIGAIITDFLGF